MHVAVIGTGVVGACSAAWLMRDGHRITFIDPREAGEACSYGNAGSLSPTACLPVGMPGMWKKVPSWLLDPDGPLVIRLKRGPVIVPWLIRFLRASTKPEVERIATALRALLEPVFDCYGPLVEHAGAQHLVRRNGCLYVYSSRESAQRWKWGTDLRRRLGIDMQELKSDEIFALEPDLEGLFQFGQFSPDNGSTPDPSALVKAIYGQAITDGATHIRAAVTGFTRSDGQVRSVTLDNGETLSVDAVVVAAGAWSKPLAAKLGAKVPLESQRGYHVMIHNPSVKLQRNVMAVEYNMMINPMNAGLRLAGSVEFAGLKEPPHYERAQALLRKGHEVFPKLSGSKTDFWMGHRPCLPDSLPVIGQTPLAENAILGFGHGHVGMCAGATTGREIANLLANRATGLDLTPFSPRRFAQ